MVEWKKLGDVCDFQNGFAFKSGLFKSEGVPIIRITNITSNNIDMTDCKFFAFDDYTKFNLNPFVVESGDILLAMSGATTGKIGVYRENEKAYLNQRVGKFVPHKTELDNRYLYHFLLSKTSTIYIMAGGGAQPNLSSNKLMEELRLPIPSINQQENIAKILDTFTSSIDNLKQQITQRRKQYEYYRDQLLDFKGNDIIEKLSFGGDFMLKARIGWQGLTKKEYRDSGEYKLITGTDFTKYNRIDFDNCVYVDKDRYDQDPYIQIHEDDVLITKDGTLGKIAYIDKMNMPATLNGGVFVVRDKSSLVLQKFLMYYLTSSYFVNWMKHNHTQGSIQHLTQALLSKFSIPVVSKDKQIHIIEILDAFTDSIQNLESQLSQREKQYEYYRNKLLTFEE